MISGKKIAILSLAPTIHDSRVLRQVEWLKRDNDVTLISPKNPKIGAVRCLEIPTRTQPSSLSKIRTLWRFIRSNLQERFWNPRNNTILKILSDLDFEILITNDFSAIPFALKLKETKTFYWIADLHEYSLDQGRHTLKAKLFQLPMMRSFLRECFQHADLTTTVSGGLSNLYEKDFGRPSIVIENSPSYAEITPKPPHKEKISLVYHGGINRGRKLENLIEAVKNGDNRFELHLYLLGRGGPHHQKLSELAKPCPRIHIHDPVSPDLVVSTLAQHDVGIYVLPPANLNHIHALPNKIFEFIQARLMLATGPSGEMTSVINQFKCGIYAEQFDYSQLLMALQSLSAEQILQFKANSARAAAYYNAENAGRRLMDAIQSDPKAQQLVEGPRLKVLNL